MRRSFVLRFIPRKRNKLELLRKFHTLPKLIFLNIIDKIPIKEKATEKVTTVQVMMAEQVLGSQACGGVARPWRAPWLQHV